MSKEQKKLVRKQFREAVFERDNYQCRCCGRPGVDRQDETASNGMPALDAHHIASRDIMPNGGYVPENGITVCDQCHMKAEQYWISGIPEPGFAPEDLYKLIGSSLEIAINASEVLGSI